MIIFKYMDVSDQRCLLLHNDELITVFSEYFNFLFAYVVITYYSLQFLSNGDTK
jgi:UDP-2,3-diacylglucosamine pyrophosphatase LpxH